MKAALRILLAVGLLVTRLCAADSGSDITEKLKPIAPFPALITAARAEGIPLEGVDAATQTNALSPGDTVTALVSLYEKGPRLTQWLIHLEVTNDAKATHPDQPGSMVMYTSTGNKYEFSSSPATLCVRTLGPFADPNSRKKRTEVEDKSATISVNKDFLSIGLDRGAAAAFRWGNIDREKKQADTTFGFAVAGEPFSKAQVNESTKKDVPLHLTMEEERDLAGWIPALVSYFGTVQQTPNLSGILLKVLRMPSLWSIARNLGVTAEMGIQHDDVAPVSLLGWNLPSQAQVYSIPITLDINKRRALTITMIATAPQPPLLACGGIIGLLAENPEDKENYLTLRVVSAHCGTGSKSPP